MIKTFEVKLDVDRDQMATDEDIRIQATEAWNVAKKTFKLPSHRKTRFIRGHVSDYLKKQTPESRQEAEDRIFDLLKARQ